MMMRKTKTRTLTLLAGILLTFGLSAWPAGKAQALCCFCIDCFNFMIENVTDPNFEDGNPAIEENIVEEFIDHRDWLTDVFMRNYIPRALMQMTEQMSAVAIYQVQVLGMLLDAKHQAETQMLFNELQNEAHRDYQPSDDFCWFGTNVRSIAGSEARIKHNVMAFGQRALPRQLGTVAMSGSLSEDEDIFGRWERFRTDYCDPQDNNFTGGNTGLVTACGAGATDPNRVNRDIDYTRLIDEPRTLNVDFTNGTIPVDSEEEDIIALANNLYGHKVLSRSASGQLLRNKQGQQFYLWLRSVAAKRSVAENSFNTIVGMKAAGTSDVPGAPVAPQTRQYMAAILNELGVADENGSGSNADEIYGIIGERPSYYAQLEILSKKIYQNPDFFASLYDSPANIARKAAALRAIELMLDRALYESEERQEMLMSVLLSSEARPEFRDINKGMLVLGED